ncbi:secreted protein [Melampsora americana]|nr:secreted protein [Melampsora americana]
MFKLQTYVFLAFAAFFCATQAITAQPKCGSPPTAINDDSCKRALKQLQPYVNKKTQKIVHSARSFQVSCADCKLTLGTANGGNLTVAYNKVELGLKNLLKDCPGKGSTVGMSDGSTNKDPKTDTGAVLTISYPTIKLKGQSCTMI